MAFTSLRRALLRRRLFLQSLPEPLHDVYHQMNRWYTCGVPTARNRYQVTETDDLERALDEAAVRWPKETRSRLLRRIISAGVAAAAESDDNDRALRMAAIRRMQGNYASGYPAEYLERLRADWPE